MKIESVRELNKLKVAGEKLLFPGGIRIQVGASRCGLVRGAKEVIAACEKEVKAQGLDGRVVQVGCIGMCYEEPLVEVIMPGMPNLTYGSITADLVPSLVKSLVKGKPQKKNLLYRTNEETLARITLALNQNIRASSASQQIVRRAMAYIHAHYNCPG